VGSREGRFSLGCWVAAAAARGSGSVRSNRRPVRIEENSDCKAVFISSGTVYKPDIVCGRSAYGKRERKFQGRGRPP
jgi:hypothetical protein